MEHLFTSGHLYEGNLPEINSIIKPLDPHEEVCQLLPNNYLRIAVNQETHMTFAISKDNGISPRTGK